MKNKYKAALMVLMLFCMIGCKEQNKKEQKTVYVDGQSFIDMNKDGQLQPYEDTRLTTDQRIDDLLPRLTVDEKISLVMGTGMAGFEMLSGFDAINPVKDASDFLIPGSAGSTTPIDRLGLPAVIMADGPAGVRISPTREGDTDTYYATGFPVGTALASTWNTQLVEEVGAAMGNEAHEYGIDILLAPALNIMRNPLCGRNFEYYSEDPLIAGKMAASATRGIQSNAVGVSLKHFAVNNSETNRMKVDAHLSQRALREIYLRGFEIAVKEADPYTIMSSYNKVNGTYTSASYDLLTTILRNEWGFKGLVMTDWFGGYSSVSNLISAEGPVEIKFDENYTTAQIKAGNDLLMPGIIPQRDNLKKDFTDGKLTEADLDINVRRVLAMIFASPTMQGYQYSNHPDLKAHAELTRRAATEGMILLKNEGATLPLAADAKQLAVFGTYSYSFVAGGTGSGNVNKAYTVSLLEGISNAGYSTDPQIDKVYQDFTKKAQADIDEQIKKAPLSVIPQMGQPKLEKSLIDESAKNNDIAVITIGRSSGEDKDRELSEFNLTADEHSLIDQVAQAYHAAGKKVVVVINVGGVIETASWKNKVDAILLAWLPGQEGGNSVADVLSGKANPSGRLTMTFPVRYEDTPSAGNFKGTPADDPTDISYTDGIYVGYRYFNSFNVAPSYEFGYGLSYTQFEYSNLKLNSNTFNGELAVSVDIKNTGQVAGKEVAQLYLSAPTGSVDKPVKELKGFVKTRELKPGETETLHFTLSPRDLASFNLQAGAWVADKGMYKVEIGASVLKTKQTASFTLPQTFEVEKVNNVLNNTLTFSDMKR